MQLNDMTFYEITKDVPSFTWKMSCHLYDVKGEIYIKIEVVIIYDPHPLTLSLFKLTMYGMLKVS